MFTKAHTLITTLGASAALLAFGGAMGERLIDSTRRLMSLDREVRALSVC